VRNEYFILIKDNKLADVLSLIPDLPYSSKTRVLEELLKSYPAEQVNKALYAYKAHYIDSNRVQIFKLKNTLKYFCGDQEIDPELT
jgi:hypothetical protein